MQASTMTFPGGAARGARRLALSLSGALALGGVAASRAQAPATATPPASAATAPAPARAPAAAPAAAVAQPPRFSTMPAGPTVEGWRPLRPAPNAPDTAYAIVDDGGARVLRAQADGSMSGLVHEARVDLRRTPILQWRWKVASVVADADLTRRAGDDYAARVYVLFDYPSQRLPLATRAKLALAETLYGQRIPTAALNYVWDNRAPVGSIHPNAYTDRARMIVLRSGSDAAGRWVDERRDVAADFRAAFGEDPPDVIGVAVATDTDNTGGRVVAWYGDVEWRAR